ncbi:MAG: aspartyl protease family protein [Candidatus Aminicenantes bacterium]|nr:aspartyl protease family protein [Candidatus Aminicenantes bacterium]
MNRKKRSVPFIFSLLLFVFPYTHCYIYGDESLTIIPFELVDDYIYIKVRINNSSPLTFGFDTGVDGTVINSTTANRLGFKPGEQISVKGASGSVTASLIRNKNLRIGHLKINGAILHEISLENIEGGLGRDIDGLIGGILLRNYPLKIDFDKKVIEIYSFEHFNYDGRGGTVPFRLAGQAMPLVSAELTFKKEEKITGVFGLDTGFAGAVMLNTPFVKKNRIASKIGHHIKLDFTGISGIKSFCYAGRLKRIQLGKYGFRNVPAMLNQANSGALAWNSSNGILGNAILKKFNIIFNYRKWQLVLEPNGFYDNDFRVNCSGIRLSLDKGRTRVLVYDVIENSPAAKAGMKRGDEILSINGRYVKNLDLSHIRGILTGAGRVVKITVKRGNGRRTFTFRLKKLI